MNTIVIEVSGGVVQEVYADENTRVILLDWDEREDNPAISQAGELKPHPLHVMPEVAEEFLRSNPNGVCHHPNRCLVDASRKSPPDP